MSLVFCVKTLAFSCYICQVSYYIKQDFESTICAIATPNGVGAIGVIRVSGQQAIAIVDKIFKGKKLSKQQSHTAHFGKIIDGTKVLDEVLVTLFVSPKSYTGENSVEISCHGSQYILQQILQLLIANGCRLAKPGEFTLRAFLNKKLDLSQAEAVADLITSNSHASHTTAMAQMRGGYSLQISFMREQLVNFASLIELELDFAEEDVEFAKRSELVQLITQIQTTIAELLQSFNYGNAIKNGIPTVIAGKPNAGKSTLLNALVNEERAIVSSIAGTTRDTIEEFFVLDGLLFRLIDTAGIRSDAQDEIETIGIQRTFEKISHASIVLYVFDASITTPHQLQEELQQFKDEKIKVLAIANKADMAPPLNDWQFQTEVIAISAKNKTGITQLKTTLINLVNINQIHSDVTITNVRHFEALQQAYESLQIVLQAAETGLSGELLAFDIRRALNSLGEITGEVTTDDLLANIFSKFCIGK